jgi:CRP-like cAMP-binding protein
MADLTLQHEWRRRLLEAVAPHPLADLLDCPQKAANWLADESRFINVDAGQVVFRQHSPSKGLYVAVSGEFIRKAERLSTSVNLGTARPGDLLELAASLGDERHTYTLIALTPGSLLLLPISALRRVFDGFPPFRMRLLEELAREVSRAYVLLTISRVFPARRHAHIAPAT